MAELLRTGQQSQSEWREQSESYIECEDYSDSESVYQVSNILYSMTIHILHVCIIILST